MEFICLLIAGARNKPTEEEEVVSMYNGVQEKKPSKTKEDNGEDAQRLQLEETAGKIPYILPAYFSCTAGLPVTKRPKKLLCSL